MAAKRILMISGSLRPASTNTALLRTAQAVAPAIVDAVLFEGMGTLPHFNPDDDVDPPPAPVTSLRAAIDAAHAVLLCSPEYAGALPGPFVNLLDWAVGGVEAYRRPFAFVNASSSPTGAAGAHTSLRTMLGYLHVDLVEAACAHAPVPRSSIGPDGLIADADIRERMAAVLATLAAHSPRADVS